MMNLKDYVADRQAWFDMITLGHAIPAVTGLNTEAKDVALRRCQSAFVGLAILVANDLTAYWISIRSAAK